MTPAQRAPVIVVTLLLAATLAPGALAWRSPFSGRGEPDSVHDANAWMFTTTNRDATDRVYFDGFLTQSLGASNTGLALASLSNANLAPVAFVQAQAMLGYWRDCDMDGFIGNATLGLLDFPVTFAPSNSPCPIGSPYNDGRFYHELRWIGPYATGLSRDDGLNLGLSTRGSPVEFLGFDERSGRAWDVNDTAARVWADTGVPGAAPTPTDPPLFPAPKGAFDSAGSTLRWLDAVTGASSPTLDGSVALLEALGHHGLGHLLDEPLNTTRDSWSALVTSNTHGLYTGIATAGDSITETANVRDAYNDSSGPGDAPTPIVAPFDCRAPGNGVTPAIADPSMILDSVNPGGSLAGTLEATAGWHKPGDAGDPGTCARGATPAILPFSNLEAATQTSAASLKSSADLVLTFTEAQSVYEPSGTISGEGDTLGLAPGPAASAGALVGLGGVPAWGSDVRLGGPLRGFGADNDPHGASYLTFYAHVGSTCDPSGSSCRLTGTNAPARTALPGGTSGYVYGAEVCTSQFGSVNGWSCDPAQWPHGTTCLTRAGDTCPRIGDQYELRDTDCIDASVAGTRVHSPGVPPRPQFPGAGFLDPVCEPFTG